MAAIQSLKRSADYAALARDAWKLRHSDSESIRTRVQSHLAQRMGRLHGLPQKLGQMMSYSSSGEELSDNPFSKLQSQGEPLPLDRLIPIMESQWNCPWDEVIQSIDPNGFAASLGQVHHAVLQDGREVAIKVQYPGIREAVTQDLKLLGWFSLPLGGLHRGFDLSAYQRVIRDDLLRELDYRIEAKNQRHFYCVSQQNPFLIVPEVIDTWSTEHVLVTQWQEADTWKDVQSSWSTHNKRTLACGLLQFFLQGLLVQGHMQADWHPGNVRFRCTGDRVQFLLYDYGSIFSPSTQQRLALARLMRATIRRNEGPWPLYLALGFNREYLEPLAHKLPALSHLLFEPFCVDYPYDLNNWNLGARVQGMLDSDRWNFRIAGSAQLVFLLRAFQGLIYYLRGLETPIPWKSVFTPIENELSSQIDQLEISQCALSSHDFSSLSKYLKIRVRENGRTKVELTQPAMSIEWLDDFLDDDLTDKIEQQGIDLESIISDIRRRGYAPGSVFQLEDQTKQIAVWLE
ncbi:MAG: AarF/UbiB family protein [Pirellulales bacterium]